MLHVKSLESIRFIYEKFLFQQIEDRIRQVSGYGQVDQNLLDIRKRIILGDAVRITDDLLPHVHQVYQNCLNILGSKLSGDLFVQQSKEYNATVFASTDKFDILVDSALIHDFSLDELSFVFGHELGHVVYGHSWFPVREIFANIQLITPEIRDLLSRWARSSEISADRIGLLCCGQLAPAITALFKTFSGLSGIDVDRVLRSFRKQYEELEQHIHKPVTDIFSWTLSHPMIPIRFKALELVALDIISFRKQPDEFSEETFRSVDHNIAVILESLDSCVTHPQVIH